jgi:hypothetical protein
MKMKQRVASAEASMNTMRSGLAKQFNIFLMAGLMSVGFMAPSFAVIVPFINLNYPHTFCDSNNKGDFAYATIKIDDGSVQCHYKHGVDTKPASEEGNFRSPEGSPYWHTREGIWYCDGIRTDERTSTEAYSDKADQHSVVENCPFFRKPHDDKPLIFCASPDPQNDRKFKGVEIFPDGRFSCFYIDSKNNEYKRSNREGVSVRAPDNNSYWYKNTASNYFCDGISTKETAASSKVGILEHCPFFKINRVSQ